MADSTVACETVTLVRGSEGVEHEDGACVIGFFAKKFTPTDRLAFPLKRVLDTQATEM